MIRECGADLSQIHQDGMAQTQEWIRNSDSIAVLTGAGISAESGVPTFRGDGGLWCSFRPEDLATPEAFERDPKSFYSKMFFNPARQLSANASELSFRPAAIIAASRIGSLIFPKSSSAALFNSLARFT